DAQGEFRAAVPQAFADRSQTSASGKECAGVRVPQRVEFANGQLGPSEHRLVNVLDEVRRADEVARLRDEDGTGLDIVALGDHALPMLVQSIHCNLWQVDRAATPLRLRRLQRKPPAAHSGFPSPSGASPHSTAWLIPRSMRPESANAIYLRYSASSSD